MTFGYLGAGSPYYLIQILFWNSPFFYCLFLCFNCTFFSENKQKKSKDISILSHLGGSVDKLDVEGVRVIWSMETSGTLLLLLLSLSQGTDFIFPGTHRVKLLLVLLTTKNWGR